MQGPPRTRTVVLAFAIVYLVWGSTYLFIRLVVDEVPPFLSAGIRFILAGTLLVAWQKARGIPWPALRHWRNATLVGIGLLLGGNGLLSWAETIVPTGIAALIIATVPLWLSLFDSFKDGRVRLEARVLAGLGVGMLGVAVLAAPQGAGRIEPLGLVALLVAALSWSAGSIASKRLEHPASLPLWSGMQMIGGGLSLLVLSALLRETRAWDPSRVSAGGWLSLAYLVLFGSVLAFSAYSWLIRHVKASAVGSYAFVNPVVAVALGALFLGEDVGWRVLVAGALIVAAAALLTLRQTRPAVPAPSQNPSA